MNVIWQALTRRFQLSTLLMLLACATAICKSQSAPDLLRNDDVIRLSQAGLSPETISALISTKDAAFQLQVSDLLELKKDGVSEVVVRAMLNKTANSKNLKEPPQAVSDKRGTPIYAHPPVITVLPGSLGRSSLIDDGRPNFVRYDTLLTSFDIPRGWITEKHGRSITATENNFVRVFRPENDNFTAEDGQTGSKHSISTGAYASINASFMVGPAVAEALGKQLGGLRIVSAWQYPDYPTTDGVKPDLAVAQYEITRAGRQSIGLLAVERTGRAYEWIMLDCPPEDKSSSFAIYRHILQSITTKDEHKVKVPE